MDKQIDGRYVASALYRDAAIRCEMGGKAFLALPEYGGDGDCVNCEGGGRHVLQLVEGGGRHVLQLVEGGPFESPPRAGQGQAGVFEDGRWYLVKTTTYPCPICGGAGSGRAKPKKAKQEPIQF